MLTIGVLAFGGAVALALFAILSQAEEKAVVRSSLRQLDDYEVESVRERELLVPLKERAIAPLLSSPTKLGGTSVVFVASGGVPFDPVYLLTATNLTLPSANWTALSTNTFDTAGIYVFTNSIAPGEPRRFFRLRVD